MHVDRMRTRSLLGLLSERSSLLSVLYALDDTRYSYSARAIRQRAARIDAELDRRHRITQARLLEGTAIACPEIPLELVCVCAWCSQLLAYCRCRDDS